jgi:hypothetical protein
MSATQAADVNSNLRNVRAFRASEVRCRAQFAVRARLAPATNRTTREMIDNQITETDVGMTPTEV